MTKVSTRQSVAHIEHDHARRRTVKDALKYPQVTFDAHQREIIGEAFGAFADKSGMLILACAVLPEHVHLVIARHRYSVEQAVVLLKGAATRELEQAGRHPLSPFPRENGKLGTCCARGEWKVFLNDVESIARAVEYVERNPIKDGLPPQSWRFVQDWRDTV